MKTDLRDRGRGFVTSGATATAALVVPLVAGYVVARAFAPTIHSRYLPWISGRALGLAAYAALAALVTLGILVRHPLATRLRRPHPESRLRAHAALTAATIALVAGHLSVLALDRYAGVGWSGAFVPGASHYRAVAVALGVCAWFLMLLLAASAALAGRKGTRHWLAVHRTSALTFALVWCHAVLAGSDTARLRVFYVVTGGVVAVLFTSRYLSVERVRHPAALTSNGILRNPDSTSAVENDVHVPVG